MQKFLLKQVSQSALHSERETQKKSCDSSFLSKLLLDHLSIYVKTPKFGICIIFTRLELRTLPKSFRWSTSVTASKIVVQIVSWKYLDNIRWAALFSASKIKVLLKSATFWLLTSCYKVLYIFDDQITDIQTVSSIQVFPNPKNLLNQTWLQTVYKRGTQPVHMVK